MTAISLVHHPDSSIIKTIYFKEDDWDITSYRESSAVYVTHACAGETGYRHVTIPELFIPKYQCSECCLRAPEGLIAVWLFLTWDMFNLESCK